MKIDVIGLGYVGLVASACLAEKGHNVTGYDTNTEKLKSISKSDIPFYEPNLNELVKLAIQKQTLELKKIDKYEDLFADAIIIAVGTPLSKMGTLDISQLQVAIKWIISNLHIFIGARMHSVVGAISTAVPCLSISYSIIPLREIDVLTIQESTLNL